MHRPPSLRPLAGQPGDIRFLFETQKPVHSLIGGVVLRARFMVLCEATQGCPEWILNELELGNKQEIVSASAASLCHWPNPRGAGLSRVHTKTS